MPDTINSTAAQGCPYAAAARAAAETAAPAVTVQHTDVAAPMLHVHETEDAPSTQAAPLFTLREVETKLTPDHPLVATTEWIRQFLARPHPDLGRPGPVCPFVPSAITQDKIWLSTVNLGPSDRPAMREVVTRYRDLFLDLEPKAGEASMWKAIVVVFPNVATEEAVVIDEIQAELKPHFVEAGLMIGEFHERNEGEGLRNPNFRPLRSPIPSVAIRFMVDSDLPFLQRMMYPPDLRATFLKSYLRRLSPTLTKSQFETAVNALVTAEIELRTAPVALAGPAASSSMVSFA
ncbi:MAG TPA: hypothetical protein VEK57_21330 [Thermoanaerobaculia bacterium]|nr:hypothetical protein [Thermoanaerobaculia bacterium]